MLKGAGKKWMRKQQFHDVNEGIQSSSALQRSAVWLSGCVEGREEAAWVLARVNCRQGGQRAARRWAAACRILDSDRPTLEVTRCT